MRDDLVKAVVCGSVSGGAYYINQISTIIVDLRGVSV